MWSLRSAEIVGVRRAVDVRIEVAPEAPVVVFYGPAGSGKSSALLGVGWGLAGKVRTLELGTLNKEQVRNALMNATVNFTLADGEREARMLRTLTMGGSHDLLVDGSKFKNLGSATEALEGLLGCTTEQLGYLTSAQALVSLDGLEQAELLLGLMGPELDDKFIMGQVEEDLHDILPLNIGSPPGGTEEIYAKAGWPLLESVVAVAETKRTEQGRTKKAAETAVETANETLMALCREARVPGPGNIAAALTQAQKGKQRDSERLTQLEQRRDAAEAHAERLLEAQTDLAAAEEQVASLKQKRAEADEIREEREAKRAEISKQIAAAEEQRQQAAVALEEASEAYRTAKVRLADLTNPADLESLADCPTCRRALNDEALRIMQQAWEEREQAVDEAAKARDAAEKPVDAALAQIDALEQDLLALPPVAPAAELEADFKSAAADSDAAYTRLEELRAMEVPAAPQPEALEATRTALEAGRAKLEALTRAQAAAEAHEAAKRKAQEASDLYDRYNALVDRLREIVREVAEEAIVPVLDRSNEMLAGRLTLGYSADHGIEAVYSEAEKRPVRELSTGERLMVGVTLQASVAVELGVGVCLVDDTSNWDLQTQRLMHEEMVAVGREHGVTWLCASTHEPLEVDGVTVLALEGGYSIDEGGA